MLKLVAYTFLLVIFSWKSDHVSATTVAEMEQNALDEMFRNYAPHVRPSLMENGTEGPVVVTVNTYVRSISDIDEQSMQMTVQLTFRQQWFDERLKFDDYNGKLKYVSIREDEENAKMRIWKPDLFFSNEIDASSHNLLVPNTLIRVFPKGQVLYSTRITLTLACPMDLKSYPFHRPTCALKMASYGYTTDDVIFLWKHISPVQVTMYLHLPSFTLEKFDTSYCTSRTNTGEYSCLVANFQFKREVSRFLEVFLSAFVAACLSLTTFWFNRQAKSARMLLLIFCFLLFIASRNRVQNQIQVSYATVFDCWMNTCALFIVVAILEYAIVLALEKQETGEQPVDKDEERLINEGVEEGEKSPNGTKITDQKAFKKRLTGHYHGFRKSSAAQKLDLACRILLPLAFALLIIMEIVSLQRRATDEH